MAPSRDGIAVFLPLVVAIGIIVSTVFIHAFALIAIVHYLRRERQLGRVGTWFWTDVIIVAGTVLVALAAHLVEVAAWALAFVLCRGISRLCSGFLSLRGELHYAGLRRCHHV